MWTNSVYLFLFLLFLSLISNISEAVKCYQCSSSEDPKGQDNCGAYRKFDEREHIAIECNSFESHMPGSFCMKFTHQSPNTMVKSLDQSFHFSTVQNVTFIDYFIEKSEF